MKEDKVIKDWLANEPSAEELAQMEKIISFTERLDAPAKTSKEDAWSSLLTKIEAEPKGNERVLVAENRKRSNLLLWVASAAAIFLVAYFSFFNSDRLITERAPAGELLTITLPDNSKVTLNSKTILSYKERGFNKNRRVVLSGEAFFEVTPGNSFKVIDSNSQIAVLGTSFNVYSREDDLKVSVFTGKVEVTSDNESVLLTEGQETTLEKGNLLVEEFNPAQTATWRIGSFYFDAEPLSKVIEELERQFDIEIKVNADINERFYSGYFNKANLTEALQLVFIPMGISFQTEGNQVTIE